MRTLFKDQHLGVADSSLHTVRKASGSCYVVAPERYQSWGRDPIELSFSIVRDYSIRLLDETRHGLRWPASHKSANDWM